MSNNNCYKYFFSGFYVSAIFESLQISRDADKISKMTIVMECSPANTSSVHGCLLHIKWHEVIDWLSPSHNLSACQWNQLWWLGIFSAFSLLAPERLPFAFLTESSSLWITTFSGSILTDVGLKIFHTSFISQGLIINEKVFWFHSFFESITLFEIFNISVLCYNILLVI